MGQFAVLLEEFGALSPETLADMYQHELGMVRYDAMRASQEAGGILAECQDEARADGLVAAAARAGVSAVKVAQEDMISVGKPILVRQLACTDDALQVTLGYTGPPRAIPWAGVCLLSGARLTERRDGPSTIASAPRKRLSIARRMAHRALGGVVLGGLLNRAAEMRASVGTHMQTGGSGLQVVELADCFATTMEAEWLHLRFRAPDLYYVQILGDQHAGDVGASFRRVLGEMAGRATEAMATPELHALCGVTDESGGAEAPDPADADFESEHAFTAYNRWQLQLIAVEWQRQRQSGGDSA